MTDPAGAGIYANIEWGFLLMGSMEHQKEKQHLNGSVMGYVLSTFHEY
jgi:hypothetical protein